MAVALAATAAAAPVAAQSQSAQERMLERQFRERLQSIVESTHGIVGIATIDMVTGRTVGVNDSLVFPQASAIKIPLLVELYRQIDNGSIDGNRQLSIRAADKTGGSGILQWFSDGGTSMSPHDLAKLMIVFSDNTATNMLIDLVGGFQAVNGTMGSLGVPGIRLQRKMIQPLQSARGSENISTPADAARLMQRIATCNLPMSRASCNELRRVLELPKNGPIPASVPAGTPVAWKPGGVEGVSTAWGVVNLPGREYVVVGMVTYAADNAGSSALEEISAAAYEYYRRLARASGYGVRVPMSLVDSIRTIPPR